MDSDFVCQQCGNEYTKWFGKCPACSAWGSLVETTKITGKKTKKSKGIQTTKAVNLGDFKPQKKERKTTKITELDRVLGGGVVSGQVVLLAGEPGVGKSTLLLQLSQKMGRVLYASGEESLSQVAIRAKRLGLEGKKLEFLETTDIDDVIAQASNIKPQLLIVDSIQTFSTSDLSGMAGSVGQVKECSYRLVKLAKEGNIPVFIVGHVTKQGSVAGPSVLMHIVDSVLWFEGDNLSTLRLIRARKNRFGSTDEVGIFSMTEKGLVSEKNPEKIFLSDKTIKSPGSVVSVTMQGTRPMLVEVQGLVVPTKTAYPRRIVQGISSNKFELILAVLIKHGQIPLYNWDCYLNISGGITVKEPAIDLAIATAIAGSFYNKPSSKNTAIFGEVGLLGDVRSVSEQDKREKEAKSLGYKNIISPKNFKTIKSVIGLIKK